MGGSCSTPVKIVDGVTTASKQRMVEDDTETSAIGFDITVRLSDGAVKTGYSPTPYESGVPVKVALDPDEYIVYIEDPARPIHHTKLTRKGTLVYGNVPCKSDAMVFWMFNTFMGLCCLLAIAGTVGGLVDWASAAILFVGAMCSCSVAVCSGIPLNILATRVYDEL
jgi:hypothetical protein